MRYHSRLFGMTWYCLRPYPDQRPVTRSGGHLVIDLGDPRWERLRYREDRQGD